MNVYGFSEIETDGEGASVMVERTVGPGLRYFSPMPVVTPEPGQTVVPRFGMNGEPCGVIVSQDNGQRMSWVFALHGHLFATQDLYANPHAMWLSWAFSRPHKVRRFLGLMRPTAKRLRKPVVTKFDTLITPPEGKTASGNEHLDAFARKIGLRLTAQPEAIAIFRDGATYSIDAQPEATAIFRDGATYSIDARGTYRRMHGKAAILAQKLVTAAA